MQLRQHVGRRLVALDDRPRRITFDDAGGAKILGDQETGIQIGVADGRRRKALRAQAVVDGDERLDILGEMNGRAVGFSVIDRRPIRTARRIHQDRCAVVANQPRIGARRGVAGHALARRIQEAGILEEFSHSSQSRHPRRRLAVAGDFGGARRGPERRAMAEGDVDAIFGQRIGRALRPFDQRQRAFRQRRQSDFLQLARIIDTIEIGVNDRERQVIALRQRERRARHFQRGIVGEIADHRARRGRLPRAEIARERDDVARTDQQCEVGHQMRRRGLVRKRYSKCRGRGHSAALRCAFWSIGKSQVTVVPLPTTESTRTLPPCSSTKERTSDRPRPAPR